MTPAPALKVGLFVTCLADLFRPSVAFATLKLLEDAGCEVEVPATQTCCGQPAYNSGAYADAIPLAKQVIKAFEHYDYLVAPSGSCAGMIKHHYPKLLGAQADWQERAAQLAGKTWEITSFLVDVIDKPLALPPSTLDDGIGVAYHDSCAGLREMGVKQQPRQLLESCNVAVKELQGSEECCGFGGAFCAKMPHISASMADAKLQAVADTDARLLLGGDLGCLLHLSGRAAREGQSLEIRHVTEILAGQLDDPALGASE